MKPCLRLFGISILTGLLFSLTLADELYSQAATVQGIITDQETGGALTGANIILTPLEGEGVYGQAADQNGFYQIAGIPSGEYAVRITFIGYTAYEDSLSLEAGENRTISLGLEPDDTELGELVISQQGGAARIQAGRQRVSAADLGRIPTPAGSGDLASYLQAMPGVVTTGDRGGQLYIRGGTPSENMVLVDGTLIYQPFHIIGFFSVFPSELVSSADVYAGGFGPRYSGRTSSVIDVRMRDGNRHVNRASGSLSPFLGEFTAEGPIEAGQASWIASMRHSLIEQTSPHFMSELQPLHFESQYLKMTHFGISDSRCSAMGLRTYDRGQLDFDGGEIFRWNNFIMGGRCVILPVDSDFLFDINTGYSYVSNAVGNSEDPDRFSKASRFALDINLTKYRGEIRFNYGAFIRIKGLNYNMSEQFQAPNFGNVHMLLGGGYVEAGIPLGDRVQFSPGVVTTMYREWYPPSIEPRMQISWQPWGTDNEELHFAAGRYSQPLLGLNDNRDASSLFTAWMPAPVDEVQLQALHFLLGWRQTLTRGVEISVESYHKRLQHIPIAVWSTFARFTTDLALADGRVYGGDVRIEVNRHPFYGFIGYGYSWTEYSSEQEHFGVWFGEPVQNYHPTHDRRHQLNSHMSLILGSYTLGVRWQLGTGLPYTRPIGFDELHFFDDRLPNVRGMFGSQRVLLDRPYGGRTPTYHRLDVSLEREIDTAAGLLTLQAGAINMYDHSNIFYYDVYTHRRINQMPFAPYLSLKLERR
ncbi:MAG: TonB-dependent receptor [Balneolaceae bacterium]